MLSKNSVSKEPPKSSLTIRLKFQRRQDLAPLIRLKIASEALCFARYGVITRLSSQYAVSRTFIYGLKSQLSAQLSNIFAPSKVVDSGSFLGTLAMIVHLRLVGRCSLYSISELLGTFGIKTKSVGFISEQLQALGRKISPQLDWQGETVAATDELYYAGNHPILVTVDVASQAILKIEAVACVDSASWHTHLDALQSAGITFQKVISDEGSAMRGGRSLLSQPVKWQPDTYHVLSGRLGDFKRRFQKQLLGLQTVIEGRATLFWSTSNECILLRCFTQWEQVQAQKAQLEQLQEDFSFLYGCLLDQLSLFEGHQAALRERSFAETEVRTAIELLQTLEIKGLDAELKTILHRLPDLFEFLDFAKQQLPAWEASMDPLTVPYWKRAWQAAKKAAKIKKNPKLKRRYNDWTQADLAFLNEYYAEENAFEDRKRTVFNQLDRICSQASSAVETVNSFLRPFLNQSRDQIQQYTLNLWMFYYNHRILKRGKHKGFSPWQILTGTTQTQTVIDMILQLP